MKLYLDEIDEIRVTAVLGYNSILFLSIWLQNWQLPFDIIMSWIMHFKNSSIPRLIILQYFLFLLDFLIWKIIAIRKRRIWK